MRASLLAGFWDSTNETGVAQVEQSEGLLRDHLMTALYSRAGERGTFGGSGRSARFQLRDGRGKCEAEGALGYQLPDGAAVNHTPDILISLTSGKKAAVELKFLSSVTDQFKARSYDARHIKKQHGDTVYLSWHTYT